MTAILTPSGYELQNDLRPGGDGYGDVAPRMFAFGPAAVPANSDFVTVGVIDCEKYPSAVIRLDVTGAALTDLRLIGQDRDGYVMWRTPDDMTQWIADSWIAELSDSSTPRLAEGSHRIVLETHFPQLVIQAKSDGAASVGGRVRQSRYAVNLSGKGGVGAPLSPPPPPSPPPPSSPPPPVVVVQSSAPTLSGSNIAGQPHVYTAGVYNVPITASYYRVDGLRLQRIQPGQTVYPTPLVHVHGAQAIEEVVAGQSFFTVPSTVAQGALQSPNAIENLNAAYPAEANVIGKYPIGGGTELYRGAGMGRRQGGGLYATSTTFFGTGYVTTDVGADAQSHMIAFRQADGGVRLGMQVFVSAGDYGLYDGGNQTGYECRIERGAAGNDWSVVLYRYDGAGGNEVEVARSPTAIANGMTECSIDFVQPVGSAALLFNVTRNNGSDIQLSHVDATYRSGPMVTAKILVIGGATASPSCTFSLGRTAQTKETILSNADKFVLTFEDKFTDTNRARINADASLPSGSVHAYRHQMRWGPDTIINSEKQRFTFPGDKHYQYAGSDTLTFDPFEFVDGGLKIKCRPTTTAEKAIANNIRFLSGALSTQNHFAQLLGAFEFTATGPMVVKDWFAAWLLSIYQQEPPEIDITELDGGRPTMSHAAIHRPVPTLGAPAGQYSVASGSDWLVTPGSGGTQDRYTLLWLPSTMVWYINGVKFFETTHDMFEPMYLLWTLSKATDQVSEHSSAGFISPGQTLTDVPSDVTIHSVRVYQRPSLAAYGPQQFTEPVITGSSAPSGTIAITQPPIFQDAVNGVVVRWMRADRPTAQNPAQPYPKTAADVGKSIFLEAIGTNAAGQKRRIVSNGVYVQ